MRARSTRRTFAHHAARVVTRSRRDERGVVVVLMAASIVAIVLLTAIVVDGSQAYPQRRRAQNAADAAAMAGARALDQKMWYGGTQDVAEEVQDVAEKNGAESATCTYVGYGNYVDPAEDDGRWELQDIGSCSSVHSLATLRTTVAGVRVTTEDVRTSAFAGLAGWDEIRSSGRATATVQKIKAVGSPFVVCGNPSYSNSRGSQKTDIMDILQQDVDDVDGDGDRTELLYRPDGSVPIDPVKAAYWDGSTPQRVYDIQKSQNASCGLSDSSWKGLNGSFLTELGGWVDAHTGNSFVDYVQQQVLGATACSPEDVANGSLDCDLILPVADQGADPRRLHIVAFAVFHVTGDGKGNPKYGATYVRELNYLSGGTTTKEIVSGPDDLRVIRMVE
ncbi:MAG: hypothetical protein KF906_10770 [Actinobacteria bacterium]|nr:hypothetical protein [Actinomycetota bacterium]